jgi:glucosamine 6-phosphate synthetase-like amidotransferase/phosphosugar isomerase protein
LLLLLLLLQAQDVAMKELAAQLKDSNSLLFFARGNNYATALEAALKVRRGKAGRV